MVSSPWELNQLIFEQEVDKLFLTYLKRKLLTCCRESARFHVSVRTDSSLIKWSFPMNGALQVQLNNNGQQEFEIDPVGVFGEPEPDTNTVTVTSAQPDILSIAMSPDNKKFAIIGHGLDGIANVTLDDGAGSTGNMVVTLVDPHAVALVAKPSGEQVLAGSAFSWDNGSGNVSVGSGLGSSGAPIPGAVAGS